MFPAIMPLPGRNRAGPRKPHRVPSPAAAAAPPQRQIAPTRGSRHGLGRIVHSLPGGTARNGESPEACARRELMEETGYQGPKFLGMYAGNNLTAYLEGTLHVFFAKECQATERRPNPDEIQSVERISVTSALSSARGGEFESAVGTLAILMADARGWLVGWARRRPARRTGKMPRAG